MKTLITLLDFILKHGKIRNDAMFEAKTAKEFAEIDRHYLDKLGRYVAFIKQKMELWMFVPCKKVDGKWVILERPVDRLFSDAKPEGTIFDELKRLGCRR